MKKMIVFVLIGLLGILLCSCSVDMNFYPDAGKYTAGNAEISEPVRELSVCWSSGSVTVEYGDTDCMTLTETCAQSLDESKQLHWYLDGDILRVQYAQSGVTVMMGAEKHLHIVLPASASLDRAKVSSSSGSVKATALKAKEIRVSTSSGAVKLTDVDAEELDLSASSGSITVSAERAEKVTVKTSSGNTSAQIGTVGAVDCGTSSGAVTLSVGEAGSVKTSSSSGTVAISVGRTADTVDCSTSSGAVTLSVEEAGCVNMSSSSGVIEVSAGRFEEMKLSTSSGGITAALAEEQTFDLTVSTSTGNFETELPLSGSKGTFRHEGSTPAASLRLSASSGRIRVKGR